jgi:UDP-2,4-diacetamido-2,4,6-trideoxy-beta-L-altropyranose hydrolase
VKWAFRVDASDAIGSGHISRCLAFAGALRADGCRVLFVCREISGHAGARVRAAGHELCLLPPGPSPVVDPDGPPLAAWLGTQWSDDADSTSSAIFRAFGSAADGLVVDHYGLDARWERFMRQAAHRIVVVDDLADRSHDCDILLDQNVVAHMASRYDGCVPPGTRRLLGPAYALLAPEFAALHVDARPRHAPARRSLLFFGGGAAGELARSVADRLVARGSRLELDVILPFGSGTGGEAPPHVHLKADLPSLAPLLARADIAAGGSGVSSLERLCLGVPAVVVTMAENQRESAEELARRGLALYLGDASRVSADAIAEALEALALGPIQAMSEAGLALVDGFGAARAAADCAAGRSTLVRARVATPADEALLLAWANDPNARAQGFHPARISPESHARWFRERLESDACCIYIVQTGAGLPVGQVRFDRGEEAWVVSYSLDAALRGRGMGARVLAAGLSAHARHDPGGSVVGLVRHGNTASIKVFEGLGFAVANLDNALEYRTEIRGFLADEDC